MATIWSDSFVGSVGSALSADWVVGAGGTVTNNNDGTAKVTTTTAWTGFKWTRTASTEGAARYTGHTLIADIAQDNYDAIRICLSNTAHADGYSFDISFGSSGAATVSIVRISTDTDLATATFDASVATLYHWVVQRTAAGVLSMWLWPQGGTVLNPDVDAPTVTVTDTNLASGFFGFLCDGGAAATQVRYYGPLTAETVGGASDWQRFGVRSARQAVQRAASW
jgi:hypothetical protein